MLVGASSENEQKCNGWDVASILFFRIEGEKVEMTVWVSSRRTQRSGYGDCRNNFQE
jgi:hypothetical protein